MNTTVTVLNAAQLIADSPAPVIMLDTCALLDIIRAPKRKEIQNTVISVAIDMSLKALENPKQLWIVAADLIDSEWKDNFQKTEDEITEHINKIDSDIVHLRTSAKNFFGCNKIPSFALGDLQLPIKLRHLAQDLLDSSIFLEEDNDCILRARNKLIMGKPPARKGKQEYKDCEIIEHYLALCKELRNNGFQKKCVFTSSNKDDYCEKNKLHTNLQSEFDAVGLEYAKDIVHANWLANQDKPSYS